VCHRLRRRPHVASDTPTSVDACHTASHACMTQLRHGSAVGRTPPEGGGGGRPPTKPRARGSRIHGCHNMAMEHASPTDALVETDSRTRRDPPKTPTATPLVGSKPPSMAAIYRRSTLMDGEEATRNPPGTMLANTTLRSTWHHQAPC
jgi:hypothetical protein